ncbi:Pentatricopeptide repeat-containing protein [Platanthera guangdongensis]|uniref:Pentatricopeptide repeat-containing protein n=1 Tax=Platanthera guangdongensis TaxID=2320717 RepID=A0ABR2M7J4_9ASPA
MHLSPSASDKLKIRRPLNAWQQLKESFAKAISTRCFFSKSLQCLHARAFTSGLHHNLFISSLLIAKYFSFGNAAAARLVFHSHPRQPTKPLLWNSLIRGYLNCQLPQLALGVFEEMTAPSSPCELDRHTFHLAITACSRASKFELGFMILDLVESRGLCSDLLVATSLVVFLAKAGELKSARRMFDEMPVRDAASWNAIISGYSQAGLFLEAMELFGNMRIAKGFCTSEGSLVSLISCCANDDYVRNGEALHAHAVPTGFESNQFVLNSLLDMYLECGLPEAAAQLFDKMTLKDSVSWSTLIGGYAKNGRPSEALRAFHEMLLSNRVSPTRPILLNTLLACAALGDCETGRWIHDRYLSCNDDEMFADPSLITALIYMYARCRKAEISFWFLEIDERVAADVIAWNAVMKACAETGDFHGVFGLSLRMQRRGVHQDKATFLMLLSVISANPLPKKGTETHALIVKRGFDSQRTVANSLIDMYAQFGNLEGSYSIFNRIRGKDVISWSTMMRACAWNGKAEEAFELFELMLEEGTRPNHFTFLAVLSACCHGGFVEKGKDYFASMGSHNLKPEIKHLTCMIDLFCRAGILIDAYYLLKDMAVEACSGAVLWGALLSACRVHGNLVIGEEAAGHLFLLEPGNVANYLMLADIYILFGKIENSNALFRLLAEKKLEKPPGFSWFDSG